MVGAVRNLSNVQTASRQRCISRSICRKGQDKVLLSKAKTGNVYTIVQCHDQGHTRARMDSLGLVVGERVKVLSASWAGIILEIKGSRLAISRSISDTVEVSE